MLCKEWLSQLQYVIGLITLKQKFPLGFTPEKKKMHLIGWKRVTKAKRMGGLGLHSMKALKCNDVSLNLLGILCFTLDYVVSSLNGFCLRTKQGHFG